MTHANSLTPTTLQIAVERALQTLSVRRAEIPGTVRWEDLRCVRVERAFGAWWQAVLADAGSENPHLRQALRDLLWARGYGDVEIATEQDLCPPWPTNRDSPHTDEAETQTRHQGQLAGNILRAVIAQGVMELGEQRTRAKLVAFCKERIGIRIGNGRADELVAELKLKALTSGISLLDAARESYATNTHLMKQNVSLGSDNH